MACNNLPDIDLVKQFIHEQDRMIKAIAIQYNYEINQYGQHKKDINRFQ